MHRSPHRPSNIRLPDFGLAAQLAMAVGASGAASLVVAGLHRNFPDHVAFMFIYVPVIGATAYFGGRTTGLVTAVLSVVSAYYFFTAAYTSSLAVQGLPIVGLFALVALLMVFAPARLRETERQADRAERRLQLLAEASAALGATFNYQTSLTNIAHLMVPVFADWCIVEVVEDGVIRAVAIVHADPAIVNMLEELQRSYPGNRVSPDDYARIILSRRTEWVPDISNSTQEAAAQDSRHLSLLRTIGTRSSLRVPIVQNSNIYGAITLGRGNSHPRFDLADQVFAKDLGHRSGAAVALGTAYRRQRAIAETLQRSLLPQQLPDLPVAAVSARYLPAEAADVGGDWYDVIPLPDGQIGLAIGDVAGRGVEAAALMGQLRTALEALAREGHPPSTVLERLDDLLHRLPLRQMVTMVYMVASPEVGRIRFTNAGHPPPLVVAPDGTARFLNEGRTVPLGVGMPRVFGEAEVVVPPESTVVLYSDGLVERRGVGLDQQLAMMEEVVRRGPIIPDAVCDRLVREMVATGERHDDVAVLAVQLGILTREKGG